MQVAVVSAVATHPLVVNVRDAGLQLIRAIDRDRNTPGRGPGCCIVAIPALSIRLLLVGERDSRRLSLRVHRPTETRLPLICAAVGVARRFVAVKRRRC